MTLLRLLALLALTAAAPDAHAQLPLLHAVESPNAEAGGNLGTSVAGVPDVNGDGKGDILVGAPEENSLIRPGLGRAYAFSGSSGLTLDTLISPGAQNNGTFGYAVAGLPDLNGNGRGEYFIGAPFEVSGGADFAGRAYVLSGISEVVLFTLVSPSPEASGFFGRAVAAVPDTDGDGRPDLLVGTTESPGGVGSAGRAYLFSGATGGLLRTLSSPNPTSSGHFGAAVAGVPDVDGDGHGDLLIGALRENPGGISLAGRAYLFSGATGTLLRTLATPNATQTGYFGAAVAGVPDVNGDGRGDLLVGARGEAPGGISNAGRAYLFSGATGVLLRTLTSPNPDANGSFGDAVAAVPDIDGNSLGDLFLGAPGEDPGGLLSSGRAYLFSGSSGVLLRTLTSPNPESNGRFGTSVAAVPDVTGDGRADLLVGADTESGGASQAGRAYLFSTSTIVAAEPETGEATLTLTAAPNPATTSATLTFARRAPGPVRLAVYDVLGREFAVLLDGVRPAGSHEATFGVETLPPGVYLVRLEADGASLTRRLTVAR